MLGLGLGLGLFNNVAAQSGGGGGGGTTFRALRIRSTAASGAGSGVALAEASIWAGGVNVTSGATVSATQVDFGAAANAVDGDLATFWATAFDNTWPQDFIFDLGATSANWKAFDQLKLTSRAGGNAGQAPGDFTIDVTTGDPAASPTWTNKATITGATYDAGQATPNSYTF